MNLGLMIAKIQVYINLTKNVEVSITPDLPRELPLLFTAHEIANSWLIKNNVKIVQL